MLTAAAHVETERPSRYLVQLCKHINDISSKGGHLRHRRPDHVAGAAPPRPDMQAQVEWTETDGIASFGWGKITMQASPGALTLRAEAADEETLQQVQDLVAGLLARVGRRAQLKVDWQRLEAPSIPPGETG
jgi:hypothetical protein